MHYKTHVDTVLYERANYLRRSGRQEHDAKFLAAMQQVTLDEAAIKAKAEHEMQRAKELGQPYQRRLLLMTGNDTQETKYNMPTTFNGDILGPKHTPSARSAMDDVYTSPSEEVKTSLSPAIKTVCSAAPHHRY